MSDTHKQHKEWDRYLTGGDVLALTGDFDLEHYLQLEEFLEWLKKVGKKYTYVLLVGGNHDQVLADNLEEFKNSLKGTNIFFLDNEPLTLFNPKVIFYGSSASVGYGNVYTAFAGTDGYLKDKVWNKIPKNIDILLTHTPPYGICDAYYGSHSLLEKVQQLPNLKLHMFGHIHVGYGHKKIKDKTFVNSCLLGNETNGPYLPTVIKFNTLNNEVIEVTQLVMDVT